MFFCHVEKCINVIAITSDCVAERERIGSPWTVQLGYAVAAIAAHVSALSDPVLDQTVELDRARQLWRDLVYFALLADSFRALLNELCDGASVGSEHAHLPAIQA